MRDLLTNYYDIHVLGEIVLEEKTGFKDEEYIYFTISSNNNKAIHMEQATLAYFLVENGYEQTAFPIPNFKGEWITNYNKEDIMVLKIKQLQNNLSDKHGQLLANFHMQNTAYSYEPQYISSYGQWKQLWIDKLTTFENYIVEEAEEHPNSFFRLLMDTLPYIIGISENAIQYIQESEHEHRFDVSDQGTITFYRYQSNLMNSIIWANELVYDHLTRDIAEFIRKKLFNEKELENIVEFLHDYETVNELSVFSWRLLYARLIYPIHIYDLIEEALMTQEFSKTEEEFKKLLENQTKYEKNLKKLFEMIKNVNEQMQIPLLHWI